MDRNLQEHCYPASLWLWRAPSVRPRQHRRPACESAAGAAPHLVAGCALSPERLALVRAHRRVAHQPARRLPRSHDRPGHARAVMRRRLIQGSPRPCSRHRAAYEALCQGSSDAARLAPSLRRPAWRLRAAGQAERAYCVHTRAPMSGRHGT